MARRRSYRANRGLGGCRSRQCTPAPNIPAPRGGVDAYPGPYGYEDEDEPEAGVPAQDETYTAEPDEGMGSRRGGWFEPGAGIGLTYKGRKYKKLYGKGRKALTLTAKQHYRGMGSY
jgi:hypothetical protein